MPDQNLRLHFCQAKAAPSAPSLPGASCRSLLRLALAAACALTVATGCRHADTGVKTAATLPKMPAQAVKAAEAIPLPPLPAGGVKGIYVTGWVAGLHNRFNHLCELEDRTELNAMVIDVKDDGMVCYDMDIPLAQAVRANPKYKVNMYDVDKVIATLNQHHIFPIARIACMRDSPLALTHPELAVHGPDGQVWHDRSKHYWLNPYKKEVWDYNVDIALNAIKHGFKEVQFDYVRFPSEGKISTLQYPGKPPNVTRSEQIVAFVKYAHDKIHAAGGWFSTDVFGLTSTVERKNRGMSKADADNATSAAGALPRPISAQQAVTSSQPAGAGAVPPTPNTQHPTPTHPHHRTQADLLPPGGGGDMGIGQRYTAVAQQVDYMCPMVYPSHYAYHEYGMPDPNKEPYKTVHLSVGDSKKMLADAPNCKLRPWLQDFSLRHVHYGPAEVKAQIKAVNDLGIHEYLLWNAGCKYTESALAKKSAGNVAEATPTKH